MALKSLSIKFSRRPEDCYKSICSAGLKNRMMFGTDFPITHWFEHKDEEEGSEKELTENYKRFLLEKLMKKE